MGLFDFFSKPNPEAKPAQEKEYRLLDKLTPRGGLIFWVKDEANTRDQEFINRMLLETMRAKDKRIPVMFLYAISQKETSVGLHVVPIQSGGWEVHLDYSNPNIKPA
jgi:hypothetical protein